jgi:hypothetical protein
MDKFEPLCFPNNWNLIASFNHNVGIRGPMDNILILKLKSPFDYIQDSYFSRQVVGQKLLLFKMLFYGLVNGVDLVRCMQPSGDLQKFWLMFDHV